MKLLRTIVKGYENYMIRKGREHARTLLLTRSDRALEDLGFSRYLLESGADAWPWHAAEETQSGLDVERLQAIQQLQAVNSRDLQDLGITHGSITTSVVLGRPGIEREMDRKVA